MTSRATTALIAAMLAIAATLLYTRGLDYVPPYLIHDEAQGALQAHAIATTGRDLSGRFLPLYFTEPEFPPGRDPALIYVTAIGFQVLPFTEAGARTPTALVAVLNVVLMYFAARALFQSTWAGVLAAVMLALLPVHFIRGRLLLSPLYSIPFVLGWLWALARFDQQPSPRRVVEAGAWLAIGMYSYLAAVVMMPIYLLMTIGVAARSLRWRGVGLASATFIICLLPMAAWYVTHPERNAQIVSAYQLSSATSVSWLSTATGAVAKYVNLYWRFFDPAYLFTSGDPSLINSTRASGLLPLAFAALLPIGLVALWRRATPIAWVIGAGFLVAPVVSVISGAIEMNRVMFVIPFAVLVAAVGAMTLWQSRSGFPKVLAAALVLSIGWQFAGFYRGYMSSSGYRLAAATWFSGNVREAARELIARPGAAEIYISTEIEWVDRMWRFYAIEAGRLDLVSRARYVGEPPLTAAAGSTLLCPEPSRCSALAASGPWRRIVVVPSIDDTHRYVILERTAGGQSN